jgi:hypothetical protein
MKNPRSEPSRSPHLVLSWQFRLKNRLLTCGISIAGRAGFDVVTVPHWDVGLASIERFPCAREALSRHAVIAGELRAAGWTAASYSH